MERLLSPKADIKVVGNRVNRRAAFGQKRPLSVTMSPMSTLSPNVLGAVLKPPIDSPDQRTENPRAGGSIPPLATVFPSDL